MVKMEFYLVKDKVGEHSSYHILSEKEWNECPFRDTVTEIACGDETFLKRMKEQLSGIPYIRTVVESGSTPLMKISRVVAVTSSGNTKYSLSPTITDPYQTDSDKEFFPDFEEDTSSSDDPSEIEIKEKSRIDTIKRKINFDCGSSMPVVSSTSEAIISEPALSMDQNDESSSQPSVSTSISSTISGEVTIHNEDITVDVFKTTHHDTFSVPLTKMQTAKPGRSVLKGVLPLQEKQVSHKCESVHPRKSVGYVLLNSDRDCVTVSLDCCILKGCAVGTLRYIKETDLYMTSLKYCDPFVDDEVDQTPVKEFDRSSVKMKLHYCMFCKQLRTCIWRHYKSKHSSEPRVKEITDAETKAQAQTLMKNLRLEGDHMYNKSVCLYDRIPVRKPSLQMISDSVHCPNCFGLIAARNFCRHHRACSKRQADRKRRLRHLQREERFQCYNADDDERTFFSIISNMTRDHLREIIEKDPLAKSLAVYLVKSQPKSHNFNNVRQQLRRLAKLFVEVKKRANVNEMKDMFVPSLYSTMATAIRDICSFSEPDEKRKSQLALTYGPLLSSLIKRLQIEAIKSDVVDSEKLKSLEHLETIHEQEFKVEVTRQALMSAKYKKMSQKSELPSTADIEKLIKFTRNLGDQLYDRLQIAFDPDSWINLGKSLLCQLLVFNRRRVGEMSRMKVRDFENRRQVTPEFFKSLNRLEIILANEFSVFTIMAKRTRPVNILVTKSQVKQLELLISLRTQAGIPEDNTFLFASATQVDGFLKASEVLRTFANQCEADNPSLLKSTKLRKHIATMSQLFCLNDNEMKQLADFLGHDRDVHEKFYRLNESNTQIIKLSKFLCTVGDGNVFQHRGKKIDELPFDAPDENAHEVEESSNEEEEEEYIREEQNEGPVPSTSGTGKQKKSQSYTLRRRSTLKVPVKLRTPAKQRGPSLARSPSKSPFTTKQLLDMVAVPQQKPVKKLRWTPQEKAIMQTEFGDNLKNKILPSLSMCEDVKSRHFAVLGHRDIHSIYCWLRNVINKK